MKRKSKLEFKQKLESLKKHIHICYSPELKKYLKRFHTIPYVAKGINEISGSTFWVYVKDEELGNALAAFDKEVVQTR